MPSPTRPERPSARRPGLDTRTGLALAVVAMAAVVVMSNVLVQHPFAFRIGRLDLADLLTWGAFSYPLAFLVTDVTNRLHGPAMARRVVYCGFAVAVLLSVWLSTPRLAIASGTAFLAGQLLDIAVFNRLRQASWWQAPAFSSLAGSAVDTAIFFMLAFAPVFVILGANDAFSLEGAPFLGLYPVEVARWQSWAAGDFAVKLLIDVLALLPYRLIVAAALPPRAAPA